MSWRCGQRILLRLPRAIFARPRRISGPGHRCFHIIRARSTGSASLPTMSPSPSSRRRKAATMSTRSFAENLPRARAAGLAVGAYHFFTFCRPGADQAQKFHRGRAARPAPVAAGGRHRVRRQLRRIGRSGEEFRAELDGIPRIGRGCLRQAGDHLSDRRGQPMRMLITMPVRQRWVRSLARQPGHDDWIYWQYHNSGRVDGIDDGTERLDRRMCSASGHRLAGCVRNSRSCHARRPRETPAFSPCGRTIVRSGFRNSLSR